jgi:hypothetical protein
LPGRTSSEDSGLVSHRLMLGFSLVSHGLMLERVLEMVLDLMLELYWDDLVS